MMRKLWRWFLVLCVLAGAFWFYEGGRLLVVDAPQKADAILVLEGENDMRPQRGLELLRSGSAPALLLDAVVQMRVFGIAKPEIAAEFIKTLPPADAARVSVCAIDALSTKAEAHAAEPCLRRLQARNVLLVTSDYHSRRALLTFRHELPQYGFSMAAARDPVAFGEKWWTQREWAKSFASETTKLVWFEVVDRWR